MGSWIVVKTRSGVAGPPWSDFGAACEEFEISVTVAAAVNVHPFAVGEVEVYFEHVAPGIQQEGTERTEIFVLCSLCLLLFNTLHNTCRIALPGLLVNSI